MPMVWNDVADAKLLSAIIQVYDVKVSGEKLNDVAKLMGPECTAKALTHRLSKIRTLAKTEATNGEGEQATDEKPKKAAKATKTGGAPKKNAKAGKKAKAERTPSPTGGDEDLLTPPDTNRVKRAGAKRNYSELAGETGSDEDAEGPDGLGKKVKIEVSEDIGEGLRQAVDDDST